MPGRTLDSPLDQILESPQLPSLPAVALEVIELVQGPDVSIDTLAETIARDAALASKVLRTVNSSFYAQTRSITTIRQAVVIMGLNSVRTLALGFSLVEGLNRPDRTGFDHSAFWRRSLRAAVASRAIAARCSPQRSEEAFLGGLLGRLGVLAMAGVLGDHYHPVFAAANDDMVQLGKLERAAFGLSHDEVGARLADHWSLPRELCAAIEHLELPDRVPDDAVEFVRLVAVGDALAGLFGNAAGESLQRCRRWCADWFNLYPEQVDELVTEAAEAAAPMLTLFDLSAGESLPPALILSRANEALARLSFEVTQESARLAVENHHLSIQASTDALTGVSNRRRFDESLEEQLAVVHRYQGTLSLVLFDLDRFKLLNDQHGHPTGDSVLSEIGRVLRATLRDADLAARYGGEEFAVILPATNLARAAEAAERLRSAIASLAVEGRGAGPDVTASFGVVEVVSSESVADLIARADQALYRAKEAGRNRVIALPQDIAA